MIEKIKEVMINSYIFLQVNKKKNERPFTIYKNYSESIEISDNREIELRRQLLITIRLNGKLHVILTGIKKDCKVCSSRNKSDGRRETTYYCDTWVNQECIINYHTQKKIQKLILKNCVNSQILQIQFRSNFSSCYSIDVFQNVAFLMSKLSERNFENQF